MIKSMTPVADRLGTLLKEAVQQGELGDRTLNFQDVHMKVKTLERRLAALEVENRALRSYLTASENNLYALAAGGGGGTAM